MTDDLADRVRTILMDDPNVGEIRMFGGLCFMLNGNMLVGVMKKGGGLLARVGAEGYEAALARPGAAPMAMGGRTMTGFVIVSEDVLDDATLRQWLALSTALVGPMPQKEKKPAKAKAKA